MFKISQICLILSLGLALESARASGTYPPAPPRLRADITAEIDPTAYNLGKLIFAGKAKLDGSPVDAVQAQKNRAMLQDVVARIPDRAREKLDVSTLSGQLSQNEGDALLYYLRLRFRLAEVTV